MMRIARRGFLLNAVLGPGLRVFASQSSRATAATLTLQGKAKGVSVPVNFTGLSYESAQLANPNFFAPMNRGLIAFVRGLGAQGVLRIGGNTSEFSVWSPQGAPTENLPAAVGPDTDKKHHRRTGVTPEAIRNLAGFLEATGWGLIYGLNLGTGTPEQAAAEAKAVAGSAGRRLIALQIGNEPDLYHRNGLRPPNWQFQDYLREWRKFVDAIRHEVPDAPFAGPDVANSVDWILDFAKAAKHEIVELTGHYYAEGPPTNPAMNIDRLLGPNPRLLRDIPRIMESSRSIHRPFRMAEGNSCYKGGKAGVSDTFASALWGGDFMLQVAQAGYSGVNFHGGGEGIYTPIAGSIEKGFSARPLYYGMLLASQFAGAEMIPVSLDPGGANVTGYAARAKSGVRIAIFNKDESRPVRVAVQGAELSQEARLWRLTAPAIDSKTGVELAGFSVNSDGMWHPLRAETVAPADPRAVELPPASATLILS